jgi:dGTPase
MSASGNSFTAAMFAISTRLLPPNFSRCSLMFGSIFAVTALCINFAFFFRLPFGASLLTVLAPGVCGVISSAIIFVLFIVIVYHISAFISTGQGMIQTENNLANYAMKSGNSAGRRFEERPSKNRLCFQKDMERILHSKAFRRLDKKTQVFVAGSGDHYRTRLTHTLEVAQISRGIARRLCLNEDLAEAIALAHDLGHPPFGHSGEDALDEIMQKYDRRFEHNQQSRLVVEKLEKSYPNFDGLNLTVEVLDGLMKHQTPWDQKDREFEVSAHLEAQIVNIADEIAYTAHDIDDGMRAGIININKLGKLKLWKKAKKIVNDRYKGKMDEEVMVARMVSAVISLMIDDLCNQAEINIKKYKIKNVGDVRKCKDSIACFSIEMAKMGKEMRKFLYDNFYMTQKIQQYANKGKEMISELFGFFMKNPKKLPKQKYSSEDELEVRVKDYIAGMTDLFLIKEYEKFILGE